jgi:hypothetical protein
LVRRCLSIEEHCRIGSNELPGSSVAFSRRGSEPYTPGADAPLRKKGFSPSTASRTPCLDQAAPQKLTFRVIRLKNLRCAAQILINEKTSEGPALWQNRSRSEKLQLLMNRTQVEIANMHKRG